ncbi:MAG TPA: hypothetical protein VKA26_00255 [Ignavibacteriaceae bacterium]|nr:hypothetical protein [Ignavibacteriaceae bacterium]HKJ81376.1 hypothetical protein [Ignavibacteriaceae bacterium]
MKKIILLLIFLLTSFSLSQTKIHSSSYAQVEPYIAINPTNPNNLLATAILTPQTGLNRVGVYYSTNGGTDWNSNENFTSTSISAGEFHL